MNELRKIVWAVDVLGETEVNSQVLSLLRVLARSTNAALEPVYLLSPAQVRVSPTYVPKWDEAFRALAEKKMVDLVNSSDIPTIQKGTVLVETDTSTRQAATRIIDYATEKKADAIVVSTHARKGLARFFLGSFAETLLLQSTLPVITVSPTALPSPKISHILFPTDFGQPSRRGFEATVELAKTMNAKLTLFFKEPPIVIPPYVGAPVMVYDYSEEEQKQRKTIAQAWLAWAKTKGAEISLEMEERPGNVSQAITEFATAKGVDLISMVAQSGPVSSLLLGSVTRQVVRNAQCPVWVRHSS